MTPFTLLSSGNYQFPETVHNKNADPQAHTISDHSHRWLISCSARAFALPPCSLVDQRHIMGVIHVESEAQFNQLKASSGTFGCAAAVIVDFSAEVCATLLGCLFCNARTPEPEITFVTHISKPWLAESLTQLHDVRHVCSAVVWSMQDDWAHF
jgi:hypothetical protein